MNTLTNIFASHGRIRFEWIVMVGAATLAAASVVQAQTNNYYGTTGGLSTNVWSTNSAGPYTSAFSTNASGGIANFGNATTSAGATGSGADSITVAGINATANTTFVASPGGTISNFGSGVIPINVSAGITLDFMGQSFTTSATAGYTFNGNSTGILGLSGATYGGGFTLNSGIVLARSVNAFGGNATPGALTINGGTLAVNSSKDFSGKYSGITVGNNFQVGALSTAVTNSSSTGNITFSNTVSLGAATRTITIGANGTYSFTGLIQGNSGAGLTVDAVNSATGTLVLGILAGSANTFSGPFTTTNGKVGLGVAGALGSVSSVTLSNSSQVTANITGFTNIINSSATLAVNDSSTLDVTGGSQTVASLSGNSANAILKIGDYTSSAGSFVVGNSTSTTYAGAITGSRATTGPIFTKQGGSTLILSGANTYSGGTSITAGTLQFAKTASLPSNTTVAVTNTGTFAVNAGGTGEFTAGTTTGPGTISGAIAAATFTGGNTAFGIDTTNAASPVSYAGSISGSQGLTKLGTGTLSLDAANTYTGATKVNGGTLLVNGSVSSTTGGVNVASGATLGGGTTSTPGTIAGATTVAAGGTITGATTGTIGTLNLSSPLTINGTYVADVSSTDGTSDLLTTTGQLTINSGSTLTIGGTPVLSVSPGSTVYVLATYATFVGMFTNFTVPSGYALQYNQTELDLVAIPEPASWLGGILLAGTVAYSQRRRFVGWRALAKAA